MLYHVAVLRAHRRRARSQAYAALADTFPFEEECAPTGGGKFGLLVREPVGVVGAIIPWNAPVALICHKIGPALLAGCTVVLKSSPEAPGVGYMFAEAAEQIGLPPGVLNVLTADREVSELLVTNPGVDKITFTGSTAAGRRIASLCGERIAALHARARRQVGGGNSRRHGPRHRGQTLAHAECGLNGQVCSSLTAVIVTKDRHDELVEALASSFGKTRVGDPFDATSQLGPLVSERQRDRVLGYIAKGVDEGAKLATGGGRPDGSRPRLLRRADGLRQRRQRVDDRPRGDLRTGALGDSRDDEQDAVRIANDTTTDSTPRCSRTTSTVLAHVASRAPLGHGRPQRLPHRLRHGVRRLQAVGHRPGGRQGRSAAVPRDQDRHPRRPPAAYRK